MTLAGKTLFISGGSRGIGLAIALRAARDGANVVIAAKTDTPHPKLAGTIHSAVAEIEEAGGKGLALVMDVRDDQSVADAVARAAEHFGGIDICVNNASAIDLSGSLKVDMKRFDLMQQINMRGTFIMSRACLPHLLKSSNPHILTLAPPPVIRPDWLAAHLPYTLAKYGMAMIALGLAEEFREQGVASNTLWPRTTVATAAVQFALGGDAMTRQSRTPDVMADAAYHILTRPSRSCTGRALIDDAILAESGVTAFDHYRVDPSSPLLIDLFVDPTDPLPPGVSLDALA